MKLPLALALALAFILFAMPVLAQVSVENPTLLSTGAVRLNLQAKAPVLLTGASLIDSQGESFQLSDVPKGVKTDLPGACQFGAPADTTVFFPFNPKGQPPYSLSLEFETPDQTSSSGCRTINLTIDNLH